MAENELEIVKGKTDILLITPHGVETEPYDDENTANLTTTMLCVQGKNGYPIYIK